MAGPANAPPTGQAGRLTKLELSQPEFAIFPLPPRTGSVETPPGLAGVWQESEAEDLVAALYSGTGTRCFSGERDEFRF